MRLRDYEIRAIKKAIQKFDENAEVYLFGSRVDESKKGGDIDLLVFSKILTQDNASRVRGRICDEIGEQKIDVLIEKDESSPFTRMVMKEAVRL